MKNDVVQAEVKAGVLVLRVCLPEVRNALSPEVKDQLLLHARRFVEDADLHCLLLTGSGDFFCAGGDLRHMQDTPGTVGVMGRMAKIHAFAQLLAECNKPVIMAVNGPAVGAGVSLALLGDLVFAVDDVYFMTAFANVGVLPDLGLLHRLSSTVGRVQANDLLFTSRRVEAQEALSLGLVSRLFPREGFHEQVLAIAQRIAAGPAVTFGLTKSLLANVGKDTFREFLLKESLAQAVVFGTADFAEGVDAFRGKRKPNFIGK